MQPTTPAKTCLITRLDRHLHEGGQERQGLGWFVPHRPLSVYHTQRDLGKMHVRRCQGPELFAS